MFEIINADCIEAMRAMEPDSVDAVVTDPPYGLSKDPDIVEVLTKWLAGAKYEHTSAGFMGKTWDSFVPGPEYWRECFRVLKPGGYLLAFAGTRTQDLMAIAIRMGGFEIRDVNAYLSDGSEDLESFERSLNDAQLDAFRRLTTRGEGRAAWLFGSGFPKSHNVSKAIDRMAGADREVVGSKLGLPGYHLSGHVGGEAFGHGLSSSTPETRFKSSLVTSPATDSAKKWDGWGTALKPAHEPIVMARKPFKGTVAANVLKYGTGALNIDGCKVGSETSEAHARGVSRLGTFEGAEGNLTPERAGRWPANLLHDGSEAVLGIFPETPRSTVSMRGSTNRAMGGWGLNTEDRVRRGHEDNGGSAARYFYCAKASKRDRSEGTERIVITDGYSRDVVQAGPAHQLATRPRVPMHRLLEHGWRNTHPTVKPTALMQYLCRLVTPTNGVILDPFMGSGSTGVAAMREGFRFIGIDMDPDYCEIAHKRIKLASSLKAT